MKQKRVKRLFRIMAPFISEAIASRKVRKKEKEVRVMQVGFQYYFVPNKVNLEGSRTVKGDMITVQNGKAVQVYKAKALTKEEVFAFYKPEINRLLLLGGGYFALLVVVSLFAYGKQFFLQKAANKIIQIMREDVFFSYSNVADSLFRSFTSREKLYRV